MCIKRICLHVEVTEVWGAVDPGECDGVFVAPEDVAVPQRLFIAPGEGPISSDGGKGLAIVQGLQFLLSVVKHYFGHPQLGSNREREREQIA